MSPEDCCEEAGGSALAGGRTAVNDHSAAAVPWVSESDGAEILDRLTALMSLLEGHADVVMDAVGPRIIPSVEAIREKFERRRRQAAENRGDGELPGV